MRTPVHSPHLVLTEAESFSFSLPKPPSANGLFGAAPDSEQKRYIAKKYAAWRRLADQQVMTQGPIRAVRGQVCIRVTIADSGPGDLDNRLKAILDFAVRHGIIADDNRECVREIHMGWGEVDGAYVEISRPSEWLPRKVQNRSAA